MASVQITAWDVAELLGLRYIGEEYDDYKGYYAYKFEFHGKVFGDETWHENETDAKESMAERILKKLGQHLATVID